MTNPPMEKPRRTGTVPSTRGRPAGAKPNGPGQGRTPPAMPSRRTWLTFLGILLVNFVIVRLLFPGAGEPGYIVTSVRSESAWFGTMSRSAPVSS